jgi:hypothetical protein
LREAPPADVVAPPVWEPLLPDPVLLLPAPDRPEPVPVPPRPERAPVPDPVLAPDPEREVPVPAPDPLPDRLVLGPADWLDGADVLAAVSRLIAALRAASTPAWSCATWAALGWASTLGISSWHTARSAPALCGACQSASVAVGTGPLGVAVALAVRLPLEGDQLGDGAASDEGPTLGVGVGVGGLDVG